MQLETFHYTSANSWSLSALPNFDSNTTLVLAFAAPEYINHPELFDTVQSNYPSSVIIGCSSAGEIIDSSVTDNSIVFAVLQFEHTSLQAASAPVLESSDSYLAGQKLAEQLIGDDLRGVFVLSPGTDVNGSELVKGLHDVLPASIPITGGLAGDGARFERTWTLLGGAIHEGLVVAVGFYGQHVRIGYGTGGGWDIFGPERRVTNSNGNVLFTLDDKPALGLYKRYLGERASGLPATALLFPLAIRCAGQNEREVVRTILSVDENRQSLTFAGDIPTGSMAQLMKANVDRLIDGALSAAQNAARSVDSGSQSLCVAVSCVGRRLVMSGRTDEELEITLENLPPGTRQIGFYSYGEIAPAENSLSDLHNQTMTLTTISEV